MSEYKPKYNYLGKDGFPHAQNVNVYDYTNEIDYSRYDYSQMSIQICSVPWEQGEAHIGQRTLSGIGNVVYFDDVKTRDAWFDAIPDNECFRWETKFKELHSDLTLVVPIPFDVACNYNYVRVTYNLFANDNSPVQYESTDGMRSWFYFIREAKFIAPNTTQLELLDDAWQTWIYNLDITNMILERGHAPMFKTKTDAYLANPLAKCNDLLAEDINYGELQQVKKTQTTVLNAGDMYAVIATSADAWGDWNLKTPAASSNTYAGVPNVELIAMDASVLNTFLDNITSNIPQFKQAVQCVFFCAKELLNVANGFTFGEVTCYRVTSYAHVNKTIFSRTKKDWGYANKYADIAKLYTFPYSALEITDEQGNTEIVHIEDTSNVLTMDIAANLVFPYINLSGTIKGIGGSNSSSITFQNINSNSLNISGRWYEHLREWNIPGFVVMLSAAIEYDYSTHFDRIQANNDRTTAQTIANRNASTTQTITNRDASTQKIISDRNASTQQGISNRDASTTQSNTNNEANNVLNNATAQVIANNAITSKSNTTARADARLTNSLAQAIQAWDAGMSRETVNNETELKNATAAVGAAGGVVNAAAGGAISGGLEGGLLGAGIGALSGLVSGGISAATSLATNQITVSALSTQAEAVISNSQSKLEETQQSNYDRTDNANSAKTANTNSTNTAISTSANNTSSTMKENATRIYNSAISDATDNYNTTTANAADTYNNATTNATDNYNTAIANAADTYNNAGNRITNQVNQAALKAPFIYGRVNNADYATTRPLALFVNIITESDYAIQRAGDEFLRFGYCLDKQWDFDGNWLIGKHFTYWQLRDYWSSNQIPDKFADQLRFLLFGGVTVWRKPEDIGKVSIYDNWS